MHFITVNGNLKNVTKVTANVPNDKILLCTRCLEVTDHFQLRIDFEFSLGISFLLSIEKLPSKESKCTSCSYFFIVNLTKSGQEGNYINFG